MSMNGEIEIGAEYEELMKESERYALTYRALADAPDHKNRRYGFPDLASREEVRCDSERMLESIKWVKKAVSDLVEEGIKTPDAEATNEQANAIGQAITKDDQIKETVMEAMKIGYLFGDLRRGYYELGDLDRGRAARKHDHQTLKRANDERSATRGEFWRPHQEDFQSLVSEGMRRDRARIVIGDRIAEGGGETYSQKTLRKWLKLDGEAD